LTKDFPWSFVAGMVFGRGNLGWFIAFVLIGAVLGTALGGLAGTLTPKLAVLGRNIVPSMGVNLVFMSVQFNINPLTLLGMVGGIFAFIKV